jgi:hypothetical protein
LLLICGGVDGKRRLADCCVLDVARRAWCAVEMDLSGSPASYPLHAAWHAMSAIGRRAVVFGGVGLEDEALNSIAFVELVAEEEAGAAAGASTKYRPVTTITSLLADDAVLPAPRFSHCSVAVPSRGEEDVGSSAMMVFGGTSATRMMEDCFIIHLAA